MPKATDSFRPNPLLAAFLAWIMPGAGHLYLRKRARGLVLLVTIAVLFWGGVAIGGAMTVSRDAEPWWFAADMLTGVHGLAGWQHQQRAHARVFRDAMQKAAAIGQTPDSRGAQFELVEQELADQKLALVPPVDTAARAFSGVAGLLNLLCIFDAMMLAFMGRVGEPAPASFGREPQASADGRAGVGAAKPSGGGTP
jgi:hypothetical protein